MRFVQLSFLIPLAPLAGSAINGAISFSGRKIGKLFTDIVACGSVLISFIVACGVFYELQRLAPEARTVTAHWFSWFDLPMLKANVAFLIDPLSVTMSLVVTGVGFLIHVYSTSYMHGDKGYARFFSYLNLFCFAMLTLVLADNLLLMFVGWEGVGLCSYLLIGFWFEHKPNAVAGMKAFIVNRIGDLGFLIGLMLLFWGLIKVGQPSVTFAEIKAAAPMLAEKMVGPFGLVTLICVFLFVGASGKSAQIPLYVWLPDAMAGPTPVSALIHAATMVTAGVYMVGRMGFLYSASPAALLIVATVGALTAVFAATIGFAQNDIKRVLAYSTVSQLGYMFLGMGTGMYSAGIFHLVTHAFFKACLFLGAGSVILGMHHEQDIKKMGGLKEFMPVTYWTFLAATLALAGIFPLAGFFSKDEILWQTFAKGGLAPIFYTLWALGVVGAFCTAFYMFRCLSLTFFGRIRTEIEHQKDESDALDTTHVDDNLYQPSTPYEQGLPVRVVLIILAALSAVSGLLGIPHSIGRFIGLPNVLESWLATVFEGTTTATAAEHGYAVEYLLMLLSLGIAACGVVLATWLYTKRQDIIERLTAKFAFVYKIVFNKYYVDELYNIIIIRPLLWFNDVIKSFDQAIIDGLVNATASLGVFWSAVSGWWDWFFVDGAVNVVAEATITSGRKVRKLQTGKIQHYFYIILFGLIVMLIWSAI